MGWKQAWMSIGALLALVACDDTGTATQQAESSSSVAVAQGIDYSAGHAMNARLGRGMNLGNGLDAKCKSSDELPSAPAAGWDACWNNPIKADYFDVLKAAGFQSVRIPIRWAEKAPDVAPFLIDPSFTARVHEVVDQAKAAGFAVIINIHHYNELYDDQKERADYALQKEKFLALWGQIATEFANEPNDQVLFELLNEPRSRVTKNELNDLIAQVWPIIRASNPQRTIMVNPTNWGAYTNIPELILPADGNVIASGHYYAPHEFTHQGTSASYPMGVSWGSKAERNALIIDFEATYQKIKNSFPGADGGTIPLNIGEFGATQNALLEQRVAYTLAVREAAEAKGMSWHYWGFAGVAFDSYEKKSAQWIPELLMALIP